MRHPRQVLTRSAIFENVWGYDFGAASNSLEVYIGYLRRKTEAGGEPRLVQTVRGVGYVLRKVRSAACRMAGAGPCTFRRRLTLAGAAAVAVAVALASLVTYFVVRSELRGQVDDSLRESVDRLGGGRGMVLRGLAAPPPGGIVGPAPEVGERFAPEVRERLALPGPPFGGPDRYAQLVLADGSIVRPPERSVELPGEERAQELAAEGSGEFFTEGRVDGVPVRVLTAAAHRGRSRTGGAAHRRDGQHPGPAPLGARRRDPGRGRAGGRARPRGHAHRAQAGERAERHGGARGPHARPEPPHPGRRHRRAQPPGGLLQHDARGPRALDAAAAPARGRRVARAAHPAHEPAHQHRAAGGARRPARGGAAADARVRDRPARGAERAGGRPRGPRARGRARAARGGGAARRARRGGGRAGAPPAPGARVLASTSRRRWSTASPPGSTARCPTCSTTPRSGAPRTGASR